jgi:hypothetical protein
LKGVATGSGSVLQFAGNTTDVILASQSVGDTAEYLALNALPAQFQNYASAVDIAAHLGADIATKDDPVVDLISANSFIWGQLVAPQLLSLGEDPPDPNYASPVVVTSFPDVTVPTGASSLTVALGHEFNDASQAAVYLQAANTAYNRYSTALANGDSISAGMQLESALYYMNMYRALISSAQTDVATVNVMLPVAAVGDETYSAQGLADLQAQIASSGLSASTMSDLESLGLSSDDINQITQNMMALDPNAYSGDLYGELNQVNGAITVPEPTTLGICGGSLVLLLRRRRRIDRVRVACQ